jgi:hypothetical protein
MPNRHPLTTEEVLEALQERSHQTVGGIEVVEYESSGSQLAQQASAKPASLALANSGTGKQGAPLGSESALVSRLEREYARLVSQFERARQDWQERERQYQDRIAALITNFSSLEQQLSDKCSELNALMAAYDTLSGRTAGEDGASSGIMIGFVEPHNQAGSTVERLKARIEERGNALNVLREETVALRAEQQRLTKALAERGQQIARLMDQLTQAEARQGFGLDFRSGLRRLFQREPAFATAVDGDPVWNPLALDETTVVLTPVGDDGSACEGSVPAALTGRHGKISKDHRNRKGASAAVRLRRYLLPVDQSCDCVFELSGSRSYVGRDVEADFCIPDATISRLHGVLYYIGGATIVEDARSTNGIYVNRQRVAHAVLKDGDVVAFGSVEFHFRVAVSDV